MAGLGQLCHDLRDGPPGGSHILLPLLTAVGVAVTEPVKQLTRCGPNGGKLGRWHLHPMVQQDFVLCFHHEVVGPLIPE